MDAAIYWEGFESAIDRDGIKDAVEWEVFDYAIDWECTVSSGHHFACVPCTLGHGRQVPNLLLTVIPILHICDNVLWLPVLCTAQ